MKRLLAQIPRKLWIIVVVMSGLALILALDIMPILRGGEIFHWQWQYLPVGIERIIGGVVGIAIYLIGVVWLGRHNHQRALLIWAFVGTIALSLLVTWIRADNPFVELYYRTVSLTATGPYTSSGLIDWASEDWLHWQARMEEFRPISQHVALSPPALPMFYALLSAGIDTAGIGSPLQRIFLPLQCNNYTLLQFTPAQWGSALWGVLMPIWAALAVFPLAACARRIAPASWGWVVAGWAICPALLMFTPAWNTFYPFLALVAYWMLLRGMENGVNPFWLIASGLIFSLLTFANFSLVPLAGLFGFYTLLRYMLNERTHAPWWRPIIIGVWFGVGALLVWGLYMLAGGDSPLMMLATAFDKHFELERPFLVWLWMHFWEWALLGGLPLVLIWLLRVFHWKQGDDVLPLALLATMLVLLLSHTARGETGRVWLFFMPFVMLAGTTYLMQQRQSFVWWGGIYGSQALLLVALISTWHVMDSHISPPPDAPVWVTDTTPQDVLFGDSMRLVGWRGVVEDGGITLYLNWRSEGFISTPYYFAALPVAPDQSTGTSVVWQPNATLYPTTCWQMGQEIGDHIHIPLPDNPQNGGWYISLTAFADVGDPLSTLTVHLPDGNTDRQLGIGGILVDE